ncbi:hypothetical protein DMENIID0001_059500 [Sergentomyia squamirostris]
MSSLTANLIKQKVNNLKKSYIDVRNWLNSSGRGVEQDGETISGYVKQKCPHFSDLDDIFGEKRNVSLPDILDSEASMEHFVHFSESASRNQANEAALQRETVDTIEIPVVHGISTTNGDRILSNNTDILNSPNEEISNNIDMLNPLDEEIAFDDTATTPHTGIFNRQRKRRQNSQQHGYAALLAERTTASKMRLEFDKKKHEDELKLQDKQMEIEEKRLRIDQDKVDILREDSKTKNDIELKRIEMEVRVRMAELKYKYGRGYNDLMRIPPTDENNGDF